MLIVEHLSKSFGGLVAVKDLSLTIENKQIVSIIGPNGAGKTTIFNLLTGIYKPDSGKITLDEQDITGFKPYRMAGVGVARTFQNIRLFRQMTSLQNVMVGYQSKINYGLFHSLAATPHRRREDKAAEAHCVDILKQCGLAGVSGMLAKNLPYGQQKRLEIARAMAASPKHLFLDEPAAGLNTQETAELSVFIRKLATMGFTVVLIEHDMQMVMNISDYIYVMDYGSMIAEGDPAKVQRDARVIEAYIGRKGDSANVADG